MTEVWILGATGRSGRAIAAGLAVAPRLAAQRLSPVLVGRDTNRLRELAAALGGPRIVTAGSIEATVAAVSRSKAAIVVNTIGPFTETALPIARACPAGTHYVDLSNELSIVELLAVHDEAVASGRTLVTGAGFGVLATESVVLTLCEGQPPAAQVRVDALPSVEIEAGRIGAALAASVIDALAAGGRRYARGRLVRVGVSSGVERLTLPDGSSVVTAAVPTGELEAAHRGAGSPYAVAASSMAPTAPLARAVLPAAWALLQVDAVRNVAKRRVAGIMLKPRERPKEFSWAHARVEWASGARREGWLRTGDAMAFTIATAVEVVSRLARDEGRPGAYTPGALFGPGLAVDAGGEFLLDQMI